MSTANSTIEDFVIIAYLLKKAGLFQIVLKFLLGER